MVEKMIQGQKIGQEEGRKGGRGGVQKLHPMYALVDN